MPANNDLRLFHTGTELYGMLLNDVDVDVACRCIVAAHISSTTLVSSTNQITARYGILTVPLDRSAFANAYVCFGPLTRKVRG
jgi:hypothetical protein